MKTNNKLRKALDTLVDVVDAWKDHLPPVIRDGELARAIKKAEAALAEPVKNYEVGTPEELYGRYEKFCCSHFNNEGDNCLKCPFSQPTCKFAWAQIPYEEGGDK